MKAASEDDIPEITVTGRPEYEEEGEGGNGSGDGHWRNQPRVPAGRSGGGRWTDGEGGDAEDFDGDSGDDDDGSPGDLVSGLFSGAATGDWTGLLNGLFGTAISAAAGGGGRTGALKALAGARSRPYPGAFSRARRGLC